MKVRHPTKAAWADAQADVLYATIRILEEKACGGYARAARRAQQVRELQHKAGRYRAMAVRFRARGE